MHCRRHGTRSTIGFWMLIAAADAVLLVTTAGPMAMLLSLAVVLTAAVAAAGLWSWRSGILRAERVAPRGGGVRTRPPA